MSNLSALLKISFINATGINGFSKNIGDGKEKRKLIGVSGMLLFVGVLVAFLSATYSYALAEVFAPMGELELLLLFAVIVSSIVIVFTYVYKAPGVLFSSKDYELLSALPIKSSTILCSKLMEMMIINYIFTALVFVPASIVYFIKSGNVFWTFFLMMIIGLIFIPMIPVIIASIIAVLISYIASKSRHKSITTILVSTIAVVGILYASIRLQDILNYFVANSSSIKVGFAKAYPPAAFLSKAMINFDLLAIVKFIAISIIPFIVFILIFSRIFNKINLLLGETYRKSNYKLGSLKTESPIKSLTNQELRKYFSISIYVMNTAVGMVLILLVSILALFKGREIVDVMLKTSELSGMSNITSCTALLALIFGIGLSCTTISSISLEGKNLWIKKTLPISEKDIFKSKILTNLIITVPLSIVINIIFFFALKFEVVYLLLNILISVIFAVLSAVAGLYINLLLPKMEWENPTTVVKQSAAVFVNMIAVFAAIVLPILALIIFKIENIKLFLTVILIILLVLTAIVWRLLNTKGVKLFRSIQHS